MYKAKVKWLEKPKDHNYVAAESYLTLHFSDAAELVSQLKRAEMTQFLAKDIFRASSLPLLGISNLRIKKDKKKIKKHEKLSPILLVRSDGKLFIADGYHRMCAVYMHDESAWISCKII